MVDRLRDSLVELDPPICAKCHVEMNWYMSKFVRGEPAATIVHLFACSGCGGVHETETEFEPVRIPPDKLSASRRVARAASFLPNDFLDPAEIARRLPSVGCPAADAASLRRRRGREHADRPGHETMLRLAFLGFRCSIACTGGLGGEAPPTFAGLPRQIENWHRSGLQILDPLQRFREHPARRPPWPRWTP